MRAAIYRRVSTSKQAGEDRFSLKEQQVKCIAYCQEKGLEIVADFEEIHNGADLDERPKLTAIRQMVRKQQIDVVVVTMLDRLSRTQNHQAVLIYECEKYGVQLKFVEETYEDSLAGNLMWTIAGFVAQGERQNFRERSARGKQQRVREGLMLPSNIPLYGYSWADDNKSRYVINPVTAPIAQRIWREAASGKSLHRVAFDLTAEGVDTPRDAWRREKGDPSDPPQGNAWPRNTLYSILHHPAYWGEHSAFRWDATETRRDVDPMSGEVRKVKIYRQREIGDQRIALPDAAPALVSLEIARMVRERFKRNKEEATSRNKQPERSLLRGGYAKCGICGLNMLTRKVARGRLFYRCKHTHTSVVPGTRREPTCNITVDILDAAVWEDVMTLLREPEYFEQAIVQLIDQDHRQDAIEAVKRNVNVLEKQEENLAWAIRNMDDATGAGRLVADYKAVVQDRQSAEEELARLEQEDVEYRAATEQLQAVKTLLYGITQSGKSFTYEKKRSILYMLNVRVMVYPHGSEPRYTVAVGKHGNVRLLLKSGNYDPTA